MMWLLWIPVAWTACACVAIVMSFAMGGRIKEGVAGTLLALWIMGPLGTALVIGVLVHKLTARKP